MEEEGGVQSLVQVGEIADWKRKKVQGNYLVKH